MNKQKLVSVIIPTKIGSATIKKTIQSVLSQSYKNYEIIVVDDNGAGTEEQIKTEKILSNLVQGNKIKYIVLNNHVNGSYARNQGFLHSTGYYINYLDDDDLLLKNKIEKEVYEIENRNADMIVCGAFFVNEKRVGFVECPKKKKNFLYNYLRGKYYFNTSTLLVKRSVIENLNGFDESFTRHQDWEFCTRVMTYYNVEVIPDAMVIKLITFRNYVTEPYKVASNAEHLLTKREIEIEKLGDKKARKIKEHYYKRIGVSFLMYKNFKMAKKYFSMCKFPLFSFFSEIIYVLWRKPYALLFHRKKIKSDKMEGLI